uniref:RAB6-interacting golgin n=1 Tax=Rodentolepis nana TaxID=102285 RepID=A0A0R3TFU6_RODNA
LKCEKAKTNPSKCVNSGQSSCGTDHLSCRVPEDESEIQDFSRKIRGQAFGILQRSQIIENEQRRKKKELDEKEQDLCWIEELKAKDREMEMNEYLAELTKKKALYDDIAKQIASQEQTTLRDFEAEKRHCEEIIANELDEINQLVNFHRNVSKLCC